MVKSFLDLFDRILKIVKSQEESREKLFRNVVEPLFLELQPVVDDYFVLFRDARDSISSSPKGQEPEAFAEIKKNREALLIDRIRIREMSDALQQEIKDPKIRSFAGKITNFFYSAPHNPSMGYTLTLFCDAVEQKDYPREWLLDYINRTLRNLENSWTSIAQSYASLRLYCLSKRHLRTRNKKY